jgi:hypothetical protein
MFKPTGSKNWTAYHGDTTWFHCGFECYHENKEPCPNDPIAECCYDEKGSLVDENHDYSGCRGTPNQYPSDDLKHIYPDTGGVIKKGWEAYQESRRYDRDKKRKERIEQIRRQQKQIHKQIKKRLNR